MYGAILGDIIGEPYEWHNLKSKSFPLFSVHADFTDDSVMTIAVAEALMKAAGLDVIDDEHAAKDIIIDCMHKWGHKYPNAGYGGRFRQWLANNERDPYNSWGNGSAMRVSAVGWLYDDLETTRKIARWTAEVTHDHPEGVKGAETIASAIYIARTGGGKDEIKKYIESESGYDLSRTCDEIRPGYKFDVSCQGSVPEAIIAFLDGSDFEDVIRNAISLGGDSDTIGAMAGSIAEAFYGVPDALKDECDRRLPDDMADILLALHTDRRIQLMKNTVTALQTDTSQEAIMTLLWYLKGTLLWVPCNAVLSERDRKKWDEAILPKLENGEPMTGMELTAENAIRLVPDILISGEDYYFPAFTSCEEMGEYGNSFSKVQKHIMEIINLARNNEKDVKGIVIDAFTNSFVLPVEWFPIMEGLNKKD